MENLIYMLAVVGAVCVLAAFFIIMGSFFITIGAMVDSYKRAKAKRKNRKNIINNMEKIIKGEK